MVLAHRIPLLEVPDVLQPERLLFHFIFIADDVPGIGRRDVQASDFYVRKYFESLCSRGVDGVLFFHLIVLATRWNTPAMQTCDLSGPAESDLYRAALSPLGP